MKESVVGQAALAWLEAGGWRVAHGPGIAPEMRADCGEVVQAHVIGVATRGSNGP